MEITTCDRELHEDANTHISGELLEGVKHVEAMKVNYPSCQGIIVPVVLVKDFR